MDKVLFLEQVYFFIDQGIAFKLIDDKVKILGKKLLEQNIKNEAINFVMKHDLEMQKLLVNNNNILASDSLIIKDNNYESKLSFAQERLWFIDKYEGGTSAYNVPMFFELAEDVDVNILSRSLEQVVSRHAILRTLVKEDEEGNGYQQVVNLEEMPLKVRQIVVSNKSELEKCFSEEALYIYKLSEEYPIRMAIYREDGEKKNYLSVIVHHIAFDGWSVDVFLKDLQSYYRGEDLEELDIQYKDFALWQRVYLRGYKLEKQLSYWREHLRDYTPLNLITDKPRPQQMDYKGATVKFSVDKEISKKLRELAKECSVSLYSVLLSGYYLMLRAYSNQNDIIVGSIVANRHYSQIEGVIGFFINSIALRMDIDSKNKIKDFITSVGQMVIEAQLHQDLPFEKLIAELQIPKDTSRHPLFQVLFIVQSFGKEEVESGYGLLSPYEREQDNEIAKFDLSMGINDSEEELKGWFNYRTSLYEVETIERFISSYQEILKEYILLVAQKDKSIFELKYINEVDYKEIVYQWNDTSKIYPIDKTIHQLFEEQAEKTPNNIAVVFADKQLNYKELNELANQLARHIHSKYKNLTQEEFSPDTLVAICVERGLEMLIGILGVLKAGGAYVPIDPKYPDERIRFILEDTGSRLLLTQSCLSDKLKKVSQSTCIVLLDKESYAKEDRDNLLVDTKSGNLAYVIYTSGTTGQPKGVMIEHRNVVNFLINIDLGKAGSWLAVTNITFDISILELLGTILRGFKIILNPSDRQDVNQLPHRDKEMAFSLFYFGNYDSTTGEAHDRYRLLLDGAKYADENDFSAIWTPERHFAEFGGLYPNPAVTSGAIAAITKKIGIRSGSCVLPLHNPIRAAEDWALIDNLSHGRVGMALATGWHENDFVLAPENYNSRKEILFQGISILQKLWHGEELEVQKVTGDTTRVKIFPRPIQAKLPFWITTAGNPDSFRKAGEVGANLLTHLLGQSIDELAEKIKIYKDAFSMAGHDSKNCTVTLMIHTFVSESEEYVLSQVKEPFKNYLKTSAKLVQKQTSQDDLRGVVAGDMESVLEHAFIRYYKTNGLFGTPDNCLNMVDQLKGIGVNELACLIDFGVPDAIVLDNLKYLNELRIKSKVSQFYSINGPAELINEHKVTHLQCTPSLAELIFEKENKEKLGSLERVLIGGEVMTASLVDKIKSITSANIYNMYGPTEATIWATTTPINTRNISIGKPMTNMQAYILNTDQCVCGVGMLGELYLGGDGVARGYLNKEKLTRERFMPNLFAREKNQYRNKLYKTGDICRYLSDGSIEYIGRNDSQVKIRGHRIELEEIERALNQHEDVKQSVVLIREPIVADGLANSGHYLVGYYVAKYSLDEEELFSYLRAMIPSYMVPSVLVHLKELPITINGKLDRKALPDPELTNYVSYEAPANDIENKLVEVWGLVLGLAKDKIGVYDDFFHLGGNSISAIRLARKLSLSLQVEVPIALLFQDLTIRGLAKNLNNQEQTKLKGDEIEF